MADEPRRLGRPPVVPGERSIQHCVVIEESLYRRLVRLASDRRTGTPDLIRIAIRRYVDELSTSLQPSSKL